MPFSVFRRRYIELPALTKTIHKGRVLSTTGTWNSVLGEDEHYYQCSIRGKFKIQESLNASNPIAVGDLVRFELTDKGNKGVIVGIDERRNYLIRQSPKQSSQVHVIAANIDQAICVVTLNYPRVKQGFLDRFLVTAHAYDIEPLIVVNKNDLYTGKLREKRDELAQVYRDIGYTVTFVSAQTGGDLSVLKNQMAGKTNLITGLSGVGKSSLLNAIYGLQVKTDTVSNATGKGKHITSFSKMYPLPNNTYVIDTPGIKEFGLIGFELYEISHFFPEMEPYLDNCQFNNCLHISEPGCAVKTALDEGAITKQRYNSYQRIIESL